MDPTNKFTKEQMGKLTPQLSVLLGNISLVSTKVGFLEGELSAYRNISPNHSKQLSTTNIETEQLTGICETLAEMDERKLRSKNVIMFNVPESSGNSQTATMSEDLNKVKNILNNVDNVDTSLIKVYRLGKKDTNKTRPIKIELSDKYQARTVLQKRGIPYGSVTIKTKNDLTMLQRQEVQNLWKELEDRKSKGENNLIIKYINNRPKIITNIPKNL